MSLIDSATVDRLESENKRLTAELAAYEEYEGYSFIAKSELQRQCFEAFIDCLNEKNQVWLLQHLRYLTK